MAITYPLTMPAYGISNVTFSPVNATAIVKSPFSFQGQVQDWGGQQMSARVTIEDVDRDWGEDWIGFLISLKGSKGTFFFGDPASQKPRGSATANALVNGSGQTGNILNGDGAPASVNGWLKRGDWISINVGLNRRMHKVVADVNTDLSGAFSIDIWPNIRISPADNSTIRTQDPTGLYRLSSGGFDYTITNDCKYNISFTCEEVI